MGPPPDIEGPFPGPTYRFVVDRIALPMERVIVTVQEHGNTSTASVPLALNAGISDGRIKRGDLLLLNALGGGMTWGSALLRY